MTRRQWVPLLFSLFVGFPVLSGCGGGGSGSSPSEIAYILSEGSNHLGSVVEYALNPSNGTFYSGTQTISTGGSSPYLFLFSPHNHYAFVLNNNNPTGTSSNGSIASFSVAGQGISSSTISNPSTGPNPVHMAVDPGGGYLVVANHGYGTTGGYVQVFSIANGTLSLSGPSAGATSPCQYPFRVVFGPGSTGASGDPVYVACSSPEVLPLILLQRSPFIRVRSIP
ncbi:MAG: beta-propeller fold lactonase family protein [Leptospirales bacterium]